jgi:uncharacterized damage-inducible protein DinB
MCAITCPVSNPPLAPDEQVSAGNEREVLETFLDLYRSILKRKVAGLSEEQLRARHVSSGTTLAGLVKHVAVVEREWFQGVLGGRSAEDLALPDGDGWVVTDADTGESLLADYDRACAESRQLAAGLPLDRTAPHPRLGRVSLRWIYVHMIEETARHAGHGDILREQTDGATGFDG